MIGVFESIQQAATKTGLTPDNIQKVVKGQNHTAGGFVWKPANRKQIASLGTFKGNQKTKETNLFNVTKSNDSKKSALAKVRDTGFIKG